jgi:hypothetical protein
VPAFVPSDAVLVLTQAALVAAPAPRLPRRLADLRGGGWAWILPLSLGLTIGLIALAPGAADGYAWLALVACPPLAAWALARGEPRRALPAAVVAGGALALAWANQFHLPGQTAALALTALSCVPLAAGLARLAPVWALKAGIVAMATLDAILVFSESLEAPNAALNAAVPAAGLPRLQLVEWGSAVMGYGDLFVAATLGAVLVAEGRRHRLPAALLTAVLAGAWDLLFFVRAELPATVPVAVALLVLEGYSRASRASSSTSTSPVSLTAARES